LGNRAPITILLFASALTLSAAPIVGAAPAGAAVHAAKVSGTWSGTWKRTTPAPTQGTMTLTLKQKARKVSGQEVVVGSACLTTNKVKGKVSGSSITLSVSQPSIRATYSGKVSGTTMSGTIEVTCNAVTGQGTFDLTKQ